MTGCLGVCAIPELGRDVDLGGETGHALDHEPADERSMIRGARGDKDCPVEALDLSCVEIGLRPGFASELRVDPGLDGVGDYAWLLVNLLEHEVRMVALLIHGGSPGDTGWCTLDRASVYTL